MWLGWKFKKATEPGSRGSLGAGILALLLQTTIEKVESYLHPSIPGHIFQSFSKWEIIKIYSRIPSKCKYIYLMNRFLVFPDIPSIINQLRILSLSSNKWRKGNFHINCVCTNKWNIDNIINQIKITRYLGHGVVRLHCLVLILNKLFVMLLLLRIQAAPILSILLGEWHEVGDYVDGDREDDGAVVLRRDAVQSLQIPQLKWG